MYRFIKPFLLMAFSLFLITACYQPVSQKANISLAAVSECRVVQHKFGETCVPVKPQRIIALQPILILDPLLALGIKPVGFASYSENGKIFLIGVSLDQVAGIENIGSITEPSFEKILMLKPDLILSFDDSVGQNYKLLSVIAPTVPIEYAKAKLSFKENFRYIAQLIGQEEKAEEILAKYQNRIKELQQRLGSQVKEIEISILSYGNGNFWAARNEFGSSQVLTDIGLRHKVTSSSNSQFSIEVIDEYDADIIFIINGDNQTLSYFLKNPLISSLKAVKNQQVYLVDQYIWGAYGPIGINRLLDELFKYLVGGV